MPTPSLDSLRRHLAIATEKGGQVASGGTVAMIFAWRRSVMTRRVPARWESLSPEQVRQLVGVYRQVGRIARVLYTPPAGDEPQAAWRFVSDLTLEWSAGGASATTTLARFHGTPAT